MTPPADPRPVRALLAGGGTAGHVSPLLAVADALTRRNPDSHVAALGTREGLEARLVPERGYELFEVPKVPFPRRPSAAALRLPRALSKAVAAADAALSASGAQVVVGFGGYVSSPAYLAARRRGIPIVLHEQNARPGLANRLGARFARSVAVTFPGTPLPRAVLTGMPLRREIATLDRAARRGEAAEQFGLDADRVTLLVTGGSLGAQRINESMAAAATEVSRAGIQVLHVTGRGKEFSPEVVAGGAPYVVLPYCDRMDLAYAAADLVLARSGASTVCEVTAVGLPAVFVPLPIGNGEQRLNAAHVVAAGGALVVEDATFGTDRVTRDLLPLLRDPSRLEAMAVASASVGERGADELVADLVIEAARGAGRA